MIVFDHEEDIAYLICLDDEEHTERAKAWIDDMYRKLQNLPPIKPWQRSPHSRPVMQTPRHSPAAYLERIRECQKEIKRGESYEICLTNMIRQHVTIDPINTYRALRESNPAPYATYLNFPGVAVLSSSPERFLTINANGTVESKPIKGTRPRGRTQEEDERLYQDLRENEKDRSENLMIVDLLRNDLGSVCDVGSVYVSNIFSVESYATVHQLVSTIHGRLRRGVSAVQCVQAAFPGGSMTGAPKKRSMEIIDRLEAGPRGVYSGSIGFFGLNGSADLSIVIRTIVVTSRDVTVGVGGAIIDLSDPKEELDEMILKSKALVFALSETALEDPPSAASM
jgi:para-aminobenzoate synthetase